MAWFKVDDGFPDHPKALAAGEDTWPLWMAGGCYCSRQLTDGFIPEGALSRLSTSRNRAALAGRLVAAGLWERVDGGWLMHDFNRYNPTREDTLAKREANNKRIAGWRAKRSGNGVGNAVTGAVGNSVGNGVSNAAPDPTRPDPTPQRKKTSAGQARGGAKGKAALPFTIAEAMGTIGHAVLVDPFPQEPKFAANLTRLIRQYPDLSTWRRIAGWLADGGDGWNTERRGKPDLGIFIARFGGWMQQAATSVPQGNAMALLPSPTDESGFPQTLLAIVDGRKDGTHG